MNVITAPRRLIYYLFDREFFHKHPKVLPLAILGTGVANAAYFLASGDSRATQNALETSTAPVIIGARELLAKYGDKVRERGSYLTAALYAFYAAEDIYDSTIHGVQPGITIPLTSIAESLLSIFMLADGRFYRNVRVDPESAIRQIELE